MSNNFTEKRKVMFGDKAVGDGEPCFVTYEAGPTHNGFSSAKELIVEAANAGADAIKFQIFDTDRLVSDRKQLFSYDVLLDKASGKTETITEPLYDILMRRSLNPEEWKELKEFSDSLGLAFFATIGFEEDLTLIKEMNCDSIKIASADLNHWQLIRHAATTGMCIQLDTGNATIGEVEEAVDIIRKTGNERIIIHQCPSGYPARLPSINLRLIETLRQMFPYPIAYSDHTPGADMDIAALTLGANLVEKTITMDRTIRSVEHIFSLEPPEMKTFIQRLRDVETAMGIARRIMQPEELNKRTSIRRSVFLVEDALKGTPVKKLKIEFRRPGDGITPPEWEKLSFGNIKRDLKSGEKIQFKDIDL